MKAFQLEFRSFFKNKFMARAFGLFSAVSVVYTCWCSFSEGFRTPSDALKLLESTLFLSLFLFILFLFLSYEFFYQAKEASLTECLQASKSGLSKLYGAQFLVLASLLSLFLLFFLILNQVGCLALGVRQPEYFLHIFLNLLLNLFLVPLVGILLGFLAALGLKRLPAYLLLVGFVLLSSPIFSTVAGMVTETTGFYLYPFYDFFNLFPPAMRVSPNYYFGYSILSYRWQQVLFWSFGIAALIVLFLKIRRRWMKTALACLCAVLCGVNMALYFQPASTMNMSKDVHKGSTADQWEYMEGYEPQMKEAAFEITRYQLNLKIHKQLSVRAALTVDQPSLSQYEMTLFHGYKVKKAEDQEGTPLSFQQEGDYVTVSGNPSHPICQLVLEYEGTASRFYANAQGTFLPGYFAYYPHSGFHEVFDKRNAGFYRLLTPSPVPFEVAVESSKQMYCNLPEQKKNLFSGVTNGVTLLSGMAAEEEIAGIRVVYPYLDSFMATKAGREEQVREYERFRRKGETVKTIIIEPQMNLASVYEGTAIFSDYALSENIGNEDAYKQQWINPKKSELFNMLDEYRTAKDRFQEFLGWEKDVREEERVRTNLLEAIRRVGEEKALAACDQYITDDSDQRAPIDFLKQLQ